MGTANMDICPTTADIDRYLRADLASIDDFVRIDTHVAACGGCRAALRSRPGAGGRMQRTLVSLAGQPACLDEALFADIVDGKADEHAVEAAREHLASCQQCAHDLRDLADFAGWMATYDWSRAKSLARRHRSGLAGVRGWRVAVALAVVTAAAVGGNAAYQRHMRWLSESGVESLGPTWRQAHHLNGRLDALRHMPAPAGPQHLVPGVAGGNPLPPPVRPPAVAMPAAAASALESLVIPRPAALAGLRGATGATGAALRLEAPVGTVVADRKPVFRWRSALQARSYSISVSVHDAGTQSAAVSEASGTTTQWTPEAPLPSGATVAWTVTARRGGGDVMSASATFRVASAEEMAALRKAKVAYGNDPLTLGVVEAGMGMLGDADRSLRRALVEAPGSFQAEQLLHSLEALCDREPGS